MGDPDVVEFASTAEGVTTTTSALTVTDQLTIDGTSAPNYDGTEPLIELDGNGLGTTGITLNAAGSSIKGLALYRYPSAQVHMLDGSSSLENSWIGLDPGGGGAFTTYAATGPGVLVEGDSNTVGSTAGAPNVISGTDLGVEIAIPASGRRNS